MTDDIAITLTEEERSTLRLQSGRRVRTLAEEVEAGMRRSSSPDDKLPEHVERLRAATTLLSLTLGDRGGRELPRSDARLFGGLLRQWRNESHLCALYEDGDQAELIEEDEATVAVCKTVLAQIRDQTTAWDMVTTS